MTIQELERWKADLQLQRAALEAQANQVVGAIQLLEQMLEHERERERALTLAKKKLEADDDAIAGAAGA